MFICEHFGRNTLSPLNWLDDCWWKSRHCSARVTFLLNCWLVLSVTFMDLMLWNFSLWFLAPIIILECPCGFETTYHLMFTLNSLQWEFKGSQLTQIPHKMSQNDLSNKAVSSNVHFLTPLALFKAHLDLYVCWCQSDNMQRTQYYRACSYCRSTKLCELEYIWECVSEIQPIKKLLQIRRLQVSRPDCSKLHVLVVCIHRILQWLGLDNIMLSIGLYTFTSRGCNNPNLTR